MFLSLLLLTSNHPQLNQSLTDHCNHHHQCPDTNCYHHPVRHHMFTFSQIFLQSSGSVSLVCYSQSERVEQ